MSILPFGYATTAGMIRRHNEDSLCLRPDLGLWAVADGMGGHLAGETASRMTVELLAEEIAANTGLVESISRIHSRIAAFSRTDPSCESMGSTVVAMRSDGRTYEIAWVGDSRAYLWDGETLHGLTRDHSYVQLLIDNGVISKTDAQHHPERHVITQSLGSGDIGGLDVGSVHGAFHANERILLCSDGLTGELDESGISSILKQGLPEQDLVDQLIEAANQHGGTDNISAILVGAGETLKTRHNNARMTENRENRHFWLLMVIVFMLLLVSVVYVYDIL